MTEPIEMPVVPEIARVPDVDDCTVVINGVGWRYLHAGTGPVLLLVHGFMGYSFSWRFVLKRLAQHYSVYAVDLPGTGFSQRSASLPGTLTSDAEHLLSFMDRMGIQQCDVVGTSRGGGLTIALAGLLAERGMLHRVRKLVLSAPTSPWMQYGLGRIRILSSRAGRVYVVHIAPRLPFVLRDFFHSLYADPATIPPDSLAGYEAALELPGSFPYLAKIFRSWMNDLKRIDQVLPLVEFVPALFLWGNLDRAVSPDSMHELHSRWENSAEYLMTPVGHMPYEEAPEEFNRIVLDFLLGDTPDTPQQGQASAAVTEAATEPG
jgi:pimeloyl-ACP methyl ester carboxylesterase